MEQKLLVMLICLVQSNVKLDKNLSLNNGDYNVEPYTKDKT